MINNWLYLVLRTYYGGGKDIPVAQRNVIRLNEQAEGTSRGGEGWLMDETFSVGFRTISLTKDVENCYYFCQHQRTLHHKADWTYFSSHGGSLSVWIEVKFEVLCTALQLTAFLLESTRAKRWWLRTRKAARLDSCLLSVALRTYNKI